MRLIDADEIKYREQLEWFGNGRYEPMQFVYESDIDIQPTVDAAPVRHGKWTRHTLGSTGYGTTVMHQCSECESMTISRFRYCPNCGARMDKDETD